MDAAPAVRAMSEKDRGAYCALFQRVFAQPPWNETWAVEDIDAAVKLTMGKKGFIGMVAEYGSRSAGYVTGFRLCGTPLFYIEQLFVDGQCQGMGIGKSLLLNLIDLVRMRGDRGVVLLTKAGSPAERFYRNNGFKVFLPFIRFNGKILVYTWLR